MWDPADNYSDGESYACTAVFLNIKSYPHLIYPKEMRLNDRLALKALCNIRNAGMDPIISVTTHSTPACGSRVDDNAHPGGRPGRLIVSL